MLNYCQKSGSRFKKKSVFADMMAGEEVAESGGRLDYRGKMILAPMVKVILLFKKQSHTWCAQW